MELFIVIFTLLAGFTLIIKGGDMFIEAAVWLAQRTKMPQVLIGATVVSVGTTLPEVTVSLFSAAAGDHGLAFTNAIGSMLCNVSVVVGVSLLLAGTVIDRKSFRKNFIIVALSSVLVFLFLLDGVIKFHESAVLLLLFGVYLFFTVKEAGRERAQEKKTTMAYLLAKNQNPTAMTAMFIGGIIFIAAGAFFLVNNIEILAVKYVGVSTTVAGVTVVALGTALPELVTAIAAIRKKAAAISIGNVIGANIINGTFLTGIVGLIAGGKSAVSADSLYIFTGGQLSTLILGSIACIVTVALLIIPVAVKGKTFRWQGVALPAVYILYITLLLLMLTGVLRLV